MSQPITHDNHSIEAFLQEPDAARLAEIVAADGAIGALDAANVLDRLVTDAVGRRREDPDGFAARMALVPALIDAGVEVNRIRTHGGSPLAYIIYMDGLGTEERIALVRQLVDAGADPQLRTPGETSHRGSAAGALADRRDRIADLRPLLEPTLNDEGRTDALITLLMRLVLDGGDHGHVAADAWLTDLIVTVPTVDLVGGLGLAPVHLAALSGDVEVLARILARADDPNIAVTGTDRLSVRHSHSLRYLPGMTAVDLIDRVLFEIDLAAPNIPDWKRDDHRTTADQLSRCRAELIRAGGHTAAPEPPRPPVRSMDLMADEWLTAHLVAGRSMYGKLDLEMLETMCANMDTLAQRLGLPLVVLYMGQTDNTLPNEYADCVIGLHVGRAEGSGLTEIAYADIATALEKARALPWDEIVDQIPEGTLRNSLSNKTAIDVLGGAVGMVAGFQLAFGVPVDLPDEGDEYEDEDEDERDWDDDDAVAELLNQPGGLAEVTPDLEIITGCDQGYIRSRPVYGIDVACGGYTDVPIDIDFTADAHAARIATLGQLADRASYYLTSIFD
ncbi:hypothetical protein KO481_35375 [Nocardia sp. NEAU-G5]|uniref:Ankyrin repeat protein n=1 Tax=Nocardia albiluteola TaxID=2842303 RepID=A0ABS6B922_9NOCA|nr:hypothetical protein [Nocardia albiluteola]MBU3066787.1 hypothetical protein [Nocardia albiluteola]